MDSTSAGSMRRSSWTTLPLPTPEGPEITMSRPERAASPVATARLLLGEFGEERFLLLGTQAAYAAAAGDLEALHDLARAHLADAGKRLEDRRHLHLADRVVVLLRQHVLECSLARLEFSLEFGPLATSNGCF